MRWKGILLTSGLLVIALIVVVLLSLRFLPETELIRRGVQDKLTELTGRQIVIGSIRFTTSFSNLITLNLDRIVVMSHDGGKVASVDRLILAPSLKGLLRGELSIKWATVKGLRAGFERHRGRRSQRSIRECDRSRDFASHNRNETPRGHKSPCEGGIEHE